MVLVVDGNSEIGAYVRINLCYLIRSRVVTKIKNFSPKRTILLAHASNRSIIPPSWLWLSRISWKVHCDQISCPIITKISHGVPAYRFLQARHRRSYTGSIRIWNQVLILNGNSENGAQVWRKKDFFPKI